MKKKKLKTQKRWYKEWFIVIPLLLASLIFRIIYLGQIEINDPTFWHPGAGTDMLTYDNQAQDILKGIHPAPYYYGPLYSYFLSIIYFIFGHNLYIARFIQHILGVITCFLIYLIAKRCFGNPVGYISLFIAAIYDMFIIHEGLLLIEFLSTFLNALLLFLLLRLEDGFSYKKIALAGIAIGLSSLARANILLFLPFILIWMLKSFQLSAFSFQLKKFGFLCLVILLTISPATIMNYIYGKKFVLISTSGPVNLWIGNNEKADGTFLFPSPSERLTKRQEEIGDKAFTEDVIRFIKEKPGDFARLTWRKFLLFWGAFEVANNMNYNQIKGWGPLTKMPFFIGFGIVAPISLLGIILSFRNRRALLLSLFLLSFMMAMVAFFVLGRYRIAGLPAFIPFAGLAIFSLYEKIRIRRWKSLLFSFLILIPFILLVHQKAIADTFFPLLHSEGIYVRNDKGLIIRDTSNDWGGGDAVLLNQNNSVKKELVLKESPSSYKKILLCFKYGTTEAPGRLVVDINGISKEYANLKFTEGLIKYIPLSLSSSLLNKGKNTFIFTIEGDTVFALPYDTSYTFGRSFELKGGKWERIKKGEFFVWLEIEK
ncbi:MAG: glycosyltransferase family 39 protein [bacterium]|nr:glycosyltransferase family 39 protein [bacterium]